MNVEMVKKLQELLLHQAQEETPEVQFNMKFWFGARRRLGTTNEVLVDSYYFGDLHPEAREWCGTTVCIAGTAMLLHPEYGPALRDAVKNRDVRQLVHLQANTRDVAERLLGISPHVSEVLFMSSDWQPPARSAYDKASTDAERRRVAATVLEVLLLLGPDDFCGEDYTSGLPRPSHWPTEGWEDAARLGPAAVRPHMAGRYVADEQLPLFS